MSIFCQKFRKLQIFDWSCKNQAIEIILGVYESSVVISKNRVFSPDIHSTLILYKLYSTVRVPFSLDNSSEWTAIWTIRGYQTTVIQKCPRKRPGQNFIMHLKSPDITSQSPTRKHDLDDVNWTVDLGAEKFGQMITISSRYFRLWLLADW